MEIRVIVADNARARIFASHTTLRQLQEIEGFTHPEGRLSNQELVSDGPGRSREHGDDYRQRTAPRDVEAARFAHLLAQHLKDMHSSQHFDSLVLVAPPKFLGLLRQQLPKPLDQLVERTVNKDLSTCSIEEIIDQIFA